MSRPRKQKTPGGIGRSSALACRAPQTREACTLQKPHSKNPLFLVPEICSYVDTHLCARTAFLEQPLHIPSCKRLFRPTSLSVWNLGEAHCSTSSVLSAAHCSPFRTTPDHCLGSVWPAVLQHQVNLAHCAPAASRQPREVQPHKGLCFHEPSWVQKQKTS